ncbi:MAG: hypothetical protein WA996_01710 [Candidatus Promineifilaceae bacterium]
MTTQDSSPRTSWIWKAALVCFIIAGGTGSLMRFGMIYGYPAGLQFVNVRHAHSHLMYFGWVTPALMGLIAAWLPRISGRRPSKRFRWVMGATILVALLAYVAFIQYGYQVAEIGERRLPLSVMAATLNMLAWYAFGILYYRATKGVPRGRALRLWDAALIFMVLASLGAWGVAVVSRLGVEDPFWSVAMTHMFLDLFSEGWMVLAVLGLAHAFRPAGSLTDAQERRSRWGENLIVIGLPLVFLLAMPVNLVPAEVRFIASLGGILVIAGLLISVWTLWPAVSSSWTSWRVPLALLALKTLVGLGMILPAAALWAQRNGLRVLYLHLLLLGFVTLGLAVAARETWGRAAVPGQRWLVATVLTLLLTLLPLTGLWPEALTGRWVLQLAAWASLGPVIAVAGMLVALIVRERPAGLDATDTAM